MSRARSSVIYHDATDCRYWWRAFKAKDGKITDNLWTAVASEAAVFLSAGEARQKLREVKEFEVTQERKWMRVGPPPRPESGDSGEES